MSRRPESGLSVWKAAPVTMKQRGPRPKAPSLTFTQRLQRHAHEGPFRESGWFRDPELLAGVGPALADLARDENPDLVLAPQSRGTLIGSLVATSLGIGLIELRKDARRGSARDGWVWATTPPDYRDRNLELSIPDGLLPAGARVLFVDDWIDTGGQMLAAHAITGKVGAVWCGTSVLVDGLEDPRLRHDYGVRSLLRRKEL